MKSKIFNLTLAVMMLLTLASTVPSLAFAQVNPDATTTGICTGFNGSLQSGANLKNVIDFFTCFIGVAIVPLIFAVAFVVFLWGVIKFMRAEEATEKEEGRQFMIWGIIALTVMVGVWGLVKILGSTFHVTNVVPQLNVNGS